MTSVQELQQANTQREEARATVARASKEQMMRGKKPRRQDYEFVLNEGEDPVSMLLVALPNRKYDELVDAHQPTPSQSRKGMNINADTFYAALLAKVVKEPELTEAEWADIWASPEWSRGEVNSLCQAADQLCNRMLDLTPFGGG